MDHNYIKPEDRTKALSAAVDALFEGLQLVDQAVKRGCSPSCVERYFYYLHRLVELCNSDGGLIVEVLNQVSENLDVELESEP